MGSKSPAEWADSHGFSRAFLYKLLKEGKAPKTFSVGKCRRISDQADAEWVAEREAESNGAAQ